MAPGAGPGALARREDRGVTVEDGAHVALGSLKVEHDLVNSQRQEAVEARPQGVVVDDAEHRPRAGAGLRASGIGPLRAKRRDLPGELVEVTAVTDPAVRPAD